MLLCIAYNNRMDGIRSTEYHFGEDCVSEQDASIDPSYLI